MWKQSLCGTCGDITEAYSKWTFWFLEALCSLHELLSTIYLWKAVLTGGIDSIHIHFTKFCFVLFSYFVIFSFFKCFSLYCLGSSAFFFLINLSTACGHKHQEHLLYLFIFSKISLNTAGVAGVVIFTAASLLHASCQQVKPEFVPQSLYWVK